MNETTCKIVAAWKERGWWWTCKGPPLPRSLDPWEVKLAVAHAGGACLVSHGAGIAEAISNAEKGAKALRRDLYPELKEVYEEQSCQPVTSDGDSGCR